MFVSDELVIRGLLIIQQDTPGGESMTLIKTCQPAITEEPWPSLNINNEKLSEIVFTLKNKTNIDIIDIYTMKLVGICIVSLHNMKHNVWNIIIPQISHSVISYIILSWPSIPSSSMAVTCIKKVSSLQ